MPANKPKPKPKPRPKPKPYGRVWQREANRLAREYTPIKSCRDCGYPVIKICCCTYCGSVNP